MISERVRLIVRSGDENRKGGYVGGDGTMYLGISYWGKCLGGVINTG
jgi:hypothetical protein